MRDLIRPEWKREKYSQTIRQQKAISLFFVKNYYSDPQKEFGDRTVKAGKT